MLLTGRGRANRELRRLEERGGGQEGRPETDKKGEKVVQDGYPKEDFQEETCTEAESTDFLISDAKTDVNRRRGYHVNDTDVTRQPAGYPREKIGRKAGKTGKGKMDIEGKYCASSHVRASSRPVNEPRDQDHETDTLCHGKC